MTPTYPTEGSQEHRVLKALLDANGAWISKRYLVHTLYFSQAGRALHNLEYEYHWPIEHGNKDEHGWVSHRIVQDIQPTFELMGIALPIRKPFSYEEV